MSVWEGMAAALLAAVLFFVLRECKSPLAAFVPLFGGLLLLGCVFLRFAEADILPTFAQYGVSDGVLGVVGKVLAVGFLCEIGSDTCEDLGNSVLAKRLCFFGNAEIFFMVWPLIKELLSVSMEMLT